MATIQEMLTSDDVGCRVRNINNAPYGAKERPVYRATYQGETIKIQAPSIMAAFDVAVRQFGVTKENRHHVSVLPIDSADRVIR